MNYRKKPEAERRAIAKRYWAHRDNLMKLICADHKIDRHTVRAYALEFKGRV